ncbi:MAG: tRNA (adenosine(37)-N6)-threonylcarbamoyltransferase complex ATPase subunit type 1 TsaE [Phycisphaerae bacterium]|jgi:tRNA threonylcarbamoyladenosine biosynthesis protein TsaE
MISTSVSQTIDLGRKIGAQLRGGEVFSLVGNLGAGKTHFIKGVVAGVCRTEGTELVSSPTFVLVNEYEGPLTVYHIDAYRIESDMEFENLGFDDMCYPNSVVLIEWANRVSNCLHDLNLISVEIKHLGETEREINLANLPDYISA